MEKKFENRDFEHFVKQNADQYRMFPSEKVWKGINNTLHTRSRWYGIGLALLLLTTATVTGIMLSNSPDKNKLATNTESSITVAKDNPVIKTEPLIIITSPQLTNQKSIPAVSPDNTQDKLFTTATISLESKPVSLNISSPLPKEVYHAENKIDAVEASSIVISKPTTLQKVASSKPISIANEKTTSSLKNIEPSIANIMQTASVTTEPVIDEEVANETENTIKEVDPYPLTIESIVNSYQYKKSSKKLNWHLFVTPVVTYRKLIENKPFLDAARTASNASSSTGPTAVYSFSDINNAVTHKPDVGLQLGIIAGYPISKKITLKGGLQFNINKYNIRASDNYPEVTTIALTSTNGQPNSISTVTKLRNVGGYKVSWLHNKYISASIPIGAEIRLSGNNKTIFGIGATVQPTYILGNRSYLISTDLKNYAQIPSLTRKWNVNTGFEVFAGYNTGNVNWRIGPQFRYQLYSSFHDIYPIKEHLFDFGIKLGVTLK